jgi:hypothetical protein
MDIALCVGGGVTGRFVVSFCSLYFTGEFCPDFVRARFRRGDRVVEFVDSVSLPRRLGVSERKSLFAFLIS